MAIAPDSGVTPVSTKAAAKPACRPPRMSVAKVSPRTIERSRDSPVRRKAMSYIAPKGLPSNSTLQPVSSCRDLAVTPETRNMRPPSRGATVSGLRTTSGTSPRDRMARAMAIRRIR